MEARKHAYQSIAANCIRLLTPGARILDFGAGPCDSTAVLARMGYSCTAVDDFKTSGTASDPIGQASRSSPRTLESS